MSNRAAISANLVDVRNVGLHKSIKLTLHVPAERAAEVVAAFGWPTAVDPVPVALARLDPERAAQPLRTTAAPAAPEDPNPPVRPKVAPEKRLARDAGMLCREAGFQQWLKREYPGAWRLTDYKISDDERAAGTVRILCHVASRSDIRPGTNAEQLWQGIVTRYENPGMATG